MPFLTPSLVTSTKDVNGGSSDSFAFNNTATETDNHIMVVALAGRNDDVSKFTFDYNSRTDFEFVIRHKYENTLNADVALFVLKNPPTGNHTLTITTNTGTEQWLTMPMVFKDVSMNIYTALTGFDEGEAASTQPSTDINTPVDNVMLISVGGCSLRNTNITIGAGQTVVQEDDYGSGFSNHGYSSYELITSASTGTMSASWGGASGQFSQVVMGLMPIESNGTNVQGGGTWVMS